MSVFINDFNIVEKTKLFGLLPVWHFNYHLGAMSEQRSEIHPHHIRILDYTNSFLFYIFDQVSSRLFCFGFFLTQGRISPMRHRDRMLSVSISFPCDFFVFKFPFLRELFSPTHKHTHTQPAADEEVEVLSYWQLSVSSPFNVRNYIQLFTKLFHLSLSAKLRGILSWWTPPVVVVAIGSSRLTPRAWGTRKNSRGILRLFWRVKSLCAMKRNKEKKKYKYTWYDEWLHCCFSSPVTTNKSFPNIFTQILLQLESKENTRNKRKSFFTSIVMLREEKRLCVCVCRIR